MLKMTKRKKIIRRICEGKKVLDIGCVDNYGRIHATIDDISSGCLGIDLNEDGLNEMRNKGYRVKKANAENFELNEVFDVIFAGALIEHLSNPGLFLDRCRKHLKDNGTLLLSTPNYHSAYRIKNRIINGIKTKDELQPERGHVVCFTPDELRSLLIRKGFRIKKIRYLATDKVPSKVSRFLNVLLPDRFQYHLMPVCKLDNNPCGNP